MQGVRGDTREKKKDAKKALLCHMFHVRSHMYHEHVPRFPNELTGPHLPREEEAEEEAEEEVEHGRDYYWAAMPQLKKMAHLHSLNSLNSLHSL